eukprot:COSAG06_NODE_2813_length_6243_cov_7.236165_9_plen_70_part_00
MAMRIWRSRVACRPLIAPPKWFGNSKATFALGKINTTAHCPLLHELATAPGYQVELFQSFPVRPYASGA